MSGTEVLIEFKKQLIIFFDELIAQFPSEGDFVILRIFIDNQIPIIDAMNVFNHKINKDDMKLRKMVKERNEYFFLEHNIFDQLDKNKVNHMKKLWRSGQLEDDDKRIIWQWFDTFIFLGDKYTKSILKSK